jgi:hypothetical protein
VIDPGEKRRMRFRTHRFYAPPRSRSSVTPWSAAMRSNRSIIRRT